MADRRLGMGDLVKGRMYVLRHLPGIKQYLRMGNNGRPRYKSTVAVGWTVESQRYRWSDPQEINSITSSADESKVSLRVGDVLMYIGRDGRKCAADRRQQFLGPDGRLVNMSSASISSLEEA
jgi:hypothetical protein